MNLGKRPFFSSAMVSLCVGCPCNQIHPILQIE
jgi:hypothetical protein